MACRLLCTYEVETDLTRPADVLCPLEWNSNSMKQVDGQPASPLVDAVRRAGVRNLRVLNAFRSVDRAQFVPRTSVTLADHDQPIPIGHGQVTTQPSLIGLMVEALRLSGAERVLEIGTGFGYQTAILARLAAHVYSIEIVPDLAERARANLERAGIHNATVVVGDGIRGLSTNAPYGAIIVSAAAPHVPPALIEQLDLEGRLVQPIGRGGDDVVVAFRKRHGILTEERTLTAASFVPCVSALDAGDSPREMRTVVMRSRKWG
jgi:protein-L-isoaspartate(D-aspartate) O-methyltransferase